MTCCCALYLLVERSEEDDMENSDSDSTFSNVLLGVISTPKPFFFVSAEGLSLLALNVKACYF
jgi:hypothetical protein